MYIFIRLKQIFVGYKRYHDETDDGADDEADDKADDKADDE